MGKLLLSSNLTAQSSPVILHDFALAGPCPACKFGAMKTHFVSWLVALALLFNGASLLAQQDVSEYPTNAALLPGKGPVSSWKGLPVVWAERHAEWAKTVTQDTNAVVFLGDSI